MRKKLKLVLKWISNRKIRRRSKDLDKFIKYEEFKVWISKIKVNKIKGKNIIILHKYKSNKLLFHPKDNKINKLIKQRKSIKQMKHKNK